MRLTPSALPGYRTLNLPDPATAMPTRYKSDDKPCHWWVVQSGHHGPGSALEALCGVRTPKARRFADCDFKMQTLATMTHCKHCNARLRCKRGKATDTDRVILAIPGITPEHAGMMVGPIEHTKCMHHPKTDMLFRWVWKAPAAGQQATDALATTGTTEITKHCHLCSEHKA